MERELLEKAAKAAGYKVRWHHIWECFVHDQPNIIGGQDRHVWVPLEDDGDSLRMAVCLNLIVHTRDPMRPSHSKYGEMVSLSKRMSFEEQTAAVRRAIVLRSAEMGEAMP